MAIYFGTIIFISFMSIIELRLGRSEKRARVVIEITVFGVMLLLALLRAKTVGGDLVNYEQSFLEWRTLSFGEIWTVNNSNIGFVLFNWLVGRFTDSVYGLMAAAATLTYAFLFLTIKEYSANPSMSLVIFIALGGFADVFSGIRQTMALAILFWAVVCLMKKQYAGYLVWLMVAVSFHSTSLVGVLYGVIVFTKRKDMFYLKTFTLAILTAIIAAAGIPLVIQLYSVNDYSGLIVRGEGGKLLILMAGILFLCYMRIRHNGYTLENVDIVAYNSCMVGVILQILALGFSLLTRLTDYFWIFYIILIPNMVMKESRDRCKIALMVILGTILYFGYNIRLDLSGIVPYKFFWQ